MQESTNRALDKLLDKFLDLPWYIQVSIVFPIVIGFVGLSGYFWIVFIHFINEAERQFYP